MTFWSIVSVEARKRMSYRADFWIGALVGIAAPIGLATFIVFAMFRESGQEHIAGYTVRGMIVYYVAVTLFGKIVRSTEMEQGVSSDIYEGALTRYLLYPASYGTFKYAQQLGSLFPTLIQVVLAGCWAPFVFAGETRMSVGSALMAIGALAVANVLYFILSNLFQLVAFWADNVWSLTVANRIVGGLLGGAMIPLQLFPDWARRILAWLPFPYCFAFPVDALFGRLSALEWSRGIGVALGWCVVGGLACRLLWRRGTLQYTGVGI